MEYSRQKHQLTLSQNTSLVTGESINNSFRSSGNQQTKVASTNEVEGRNNYNNKSFALNADYRYSNYMNFRQKIKSFNAKYSLNMNETSNERTDLTEFISFNNTNDTSNFNRKYTNDGNNITQNLFAEVPQLKRLFFGDKKLAGIDFNISNEFNLRNSTQNSQVADFDKSTKEYNINSYLSNNLRTGILNLNYALEYENLPLRVSTLVNKPSNQGLFLIGKEILSTFLLAWVTVHAPNAKQ